MIWNSIAINHIYDAVFGIINHKQKILNKTNMVFVFLFFFRNSAECKCHKNQEKRLRIVVQTKIIINFLWPSQEFGNNDLLSCQIPKMPKKIAKQPKMRFGQYAKSVLNYAATILDCQQCSKAFKHQPLCFLSSAISTF